jgi:hypothetical protein
MAMAKNKTTLLLVDDKALRTALESHNTINGVNSNALSHLYNRNISCETCSLGGVMVRVFATGTKAPGFKSGCGDTF